MKNNKILFYFFLDLEQVLDFNQLNKIIFQALVNV
jgi:hypothetical protein